MGRKIAPMIEYNIIRLKGFNEEELANMQLEEGVVDLIRIVSQHGYIPTASCDGHNGKDRPYITVRKGLGDGWLERYASQFGLKKREILPSSCCANATEDFCGKCGAGLNADVYEGQRGKPFYPKLIEV